jgi:sugar phosphate isomerase/epimerase
LFPGSIKIAGPNVDEKRVLGYLDTVAGNAQKAGIPVLVLGSGGARKLPDNYDKESAKTEFAKLARKMAEVAKKHKVTIVLENLNSTETNFLNTLKDAAAVVNSVNHPNFRLNADIYHMLKENESPEEILKAKSIVAYCEVAEKDERTLPGVKGDDFKPYFSALRKINYKGPIIIEGRTKDLKKDAPAAFSFLTQQLKECYAVNK